MRETFKDHTFKKETSSGWLCRREKSWFYGFRVLWAPGTLVIVGDCGEMVVNHYSFTTPYRAAAWVRGAGWDYFMEKSQFGQEYDQEATARHLVENAYEYLKHWNSLDHFKTLNDVGDECGGLFFNKKDVSDPIERKELCREIISLGESDSLDAHDLCAATEDFESLVHSYPEKHRLKYEAIRWWADALWENEPLYHKAWRYWIRVKYDTEGALDALEDFIKPNESWA